MKAKWRHSPTSGPSGFKRSWFSAFGLWGARSGGVWCLLAVPALQPPQRFAKDAVWSALYGKLRGKIFYPTANTTLPRLGSGSEVRRCGCIKSVCKKTKLVLAGMEGRGGSASGCWPPLPHAHPHPLQAHSKTNAVVTQNLELRLYSSLWTHRTGEAAVPYVGAYRAPMVIPSGMDTHSFPL